MKLFLSNEHATNLIPATYQFLFEDDIPVLDTHEAYDPGTLDLFHHLEPLADHAINQTVSRLLVETNRSLHHASLFSRYTKNLSFTEKNLLLEKYYYPYRNRVEEIIKAEIDKGEKVLHISLHSFTPELDGEIRNCHVGLLYDPSRSAEKEFCSMFKMELQKQLKDSRIRFNYPYLGIADGLPTYLRKIFPERYIGIELEINQKLAVHNEMDTEYKTAIYSALVNILNKKSPE